MTRFAGRLAARVGLAILLATAAAVPMATSAEREVWKELLREQLVTEKGCELNYITNERWVDIAGRASVMARAHCIDKRQFDVSWQEEKQKFEIRLCQPQVC